MTTEDYGGYLDDLLSLDSSLSDWEVEFVESLYRQRKASADGWWSPSPKQVKKLKEIWEEKHA